MLKKFLIGTFVAFALLVGVTASAAYDFGPTTLKVGSSGDYVKTLQQFVGASPVDGMFGNMTKAKVMAWQASNGLTADGMFGNLSKAKANDAQSNFPAGCVSATGYSSLTGLPCSTVVVPPGPTPGLPAGCVSTAGYSSTTGQKCDSTTGGTTPGVLGTNEGEIDQVDVVSADDSTVEEGKTGEIFAFDFEVEGDVMVDRVDFFIEVDDSTNGSEDADDYFSEAMLMVDGKEVATLDVDDFDDSTNIIDGDDDGVTADQEFRIRFSGVNAIFADGDKPEFVLALKANNTIDSGDLDEDWIVALDVDSIRYVDGKGFSDSTGTYEVDSFGFVVEGDGEDLEIKSSSNDPDSAVLLVDADEDSEWHEVFIFKASADENDFDLETLVLTVTTGTENYEDVVEDVKIEIDGQVFDDFTVADGNSVTADLTFDLDHDYTLEADTQEEITVSIMFKATDDNAAYVSGAETVQVKTVSLKGEGTDDITDTATINGETHTLSVSEVLVTDVSETSSKNDTEDVGYFNFEFTVGAEDGEVEFVADATPDGTDTGLGFTVTGGNKDVAATLVLIDGDADYDAGTWTIAEGDEATFALDVTVGSTGDAGSYRVTLDDVAGINVNKLSGPENLILGA